MGSLPWLASRNGILTFYTYGFASACCTMSHTLYGTMQCLATAMPATLEATLTATAIAATAALTEIALAVVTKTATVSSAGWQCVHNSAVRGLRFGAFFGLR